MQRKVHFFLSLGLLAVHVMLYGILPAVGFSRQELLAQVGLLPADFWKFSQPLALFTSVFLFFNWSELFAAVFLLSSLLRFLEQEIGGFRFFSLFFVAGSLGGVPLLWAWPDSYSIYYTGSAGIWGLLVVLSLFYPKGRAGILFWDLPFGVLLGFGWVVALLLLFPWNFGNFGEFVDWKIANGPKIWLLPFLGAFFGVLYARLALGLPVLGRLSFEPRLWYLRVEHTKKRRENEYFQELQSLTSQSAILGSGVEEERSTLSPQHGPLKQESPSLHKHEIQRKLFYDPKTGRFILLKDER